MGRIHKLLHLDRWHLHLILHLLGHLIVLLGDKGLLLRVSGERLLLDLDQVLTLGLLRCHMLH